LKIAPFDANDDTSKRPPGVIAAAAGTARTGPESSGPTRFHYTGQQNKAKRRCVIEFLNSETIRGAEISVIDFTPLGSRTAHEIFFSIS
jgi:hypothetical protein